MRYKKLKWPRGHSKQLPLTFLFLAVWMTWLLLLMGPADLSAQMIETSETAGRVSLSVSAAPLYQFQSHATGGGDFSVSRYSLSTNASMPIDDRVRVGVSLTYEFDDYNFSNLGGFPVSNPWNKINRVGLGGRVLYKIGDNWGLLIGPTVQYAGEEGADFDQSLMYGGIIAASYRASRDLVIGFGAGIFYRLEETRVFPSPLISWKITDRLRLGNTYRVGPAGPAGLELGYTLDNDWELGVGGGYRSLRFRLDKSGPVPSGIGENDSWPIYIRLSRKLWRRVHLDFYGGAAFGGKLKLDDTGGHEINSISYNTTPLGGFTLSASF